MRLFLFIVAISVSLASVGCNSDLKCRRETAILRAEYLDLEDKYYAVLAGSGSGDPSLANAPLSNAPFANVSSGAVVANGSSVIYGSGVSPQGHALAEYSQSGYPVSGQPAVHYGSAPPEIVYYDQHNYDQHNYGQHNGYPVDGQAYYPPAEYSQTEYPQTEYPQSYSPALQYSPVPTPATVLDDVDESSGSSLRSSQSDEPDGYSPSPVEQLESDDADEAFSEGVLPTPDRGDDQSRFDLGPDDFHEIGHQTRVEPLSPITEIVINKSISKGKNTDGRLGDDGIELLIQPRGAAGSVVEEAGNLTVSLIDPAADQGQRQIGHWTFLKEEAELFFAVDELDNRGILLDLKWDGLIPVNKRLTVYVRFETSDGRVMETTSDIIIDPPNDLPLVDQHVDDSRFISIDRDLDQGWYKSQAGQKRSQSEAEVNDRNLNWGRSVDNSADAAFVPRSPRQPQWRPAR